MDKVLLYGFTRSEQFLCRDCFRMLFPHASFPERDVTGDVRAEDFSAAVVHCRFSGWEAVETARKFTEEQKKVVLFSLRSPNAVLFERARLEADEKPELVLLLFCPESLTDIAGCAEAVSGKRDGFVSPAALRMKKNCSLSRFIDLSALTKTDIGIVHGILEGRLNKEIAAGLGRSQDYIKTRMGVLRERYEILRMPEKLRALLGWLAD